MEELDNKYCDLASEIKKQVIIFEEIALLDNLVIQKTMQELNSNDIIIALINADEAVKEKIFNNMSESDADSIKKGIEDLMTINPETWVIHDFREKMVTVIRNLEKSGEITINRIFN